MQFNVAQREIILKVVYYGPPLSGKTTNLQAVHRLLPAAQCGKLTVLDTADDRTLFFDMLPVTMATSSGYRIKLKLFTVPGQIIHAATRRLVLAGADGIVFVADSQRSESKANNEFWRGMRRYLEERGIDPDTLPTVIQFNKRDLPDVRSDRELAEIQAKGRERLFRAVAIRGEGVLDTLYGLLLDVFSDLNRRYEIETKFQMEATSFLSSIFGHEYRPTQVAAVGATG